MNFHDLTNFEQIHENFSKFTKNAFWKPSLQCLIGLELLTREIEPTRIFSKAFFGKLILHKNLFTQVSKRF